MKKILFVIISALLIYVVLFSPVFQIKSVQLDQNANCISDETKKELDKITGKNIFLLRTKKLEQSIKESAICIETLKLEKKFPNKILLSATTKKPVAKIEGTSFKATKDGLIIESQLEENLPSIFLPENLSAKIGEKIEDQVAVKMLEVAAGLEKSDFFPTSIRVIDGQDIAAYSSSNAVAIFASSKDISAQVDSLQALLAKAKIDPTKIEKIDLRFDKGVVTYKK